MLLAIILYVVGGLVAILGIYWIVDSHNEYTVNKVTYVDCDDVGFAMGIIAVFIACIIITVGWSAQQDAATETKIYTAEVQVVAIECSQGEPTATFHSEEHSGCVRISIDEYVELEVGDTITIEITERIYNGHDHGVKTYKVLR